MILVKHDLTPSIHHNVSMLLPIGYSLNRRVAEANVGDEIVFMDGLKATVVFVCVVKRLTPEVESLSWLLYDMPIEKVFDVMSRNWRHEIYKDEIIHLVVKPIKDEEETRTT